MIADIKLDKNTFTVIDVEWRIENLTGALHDRKLSHPL